MDYNKIVKDLIAYPTEANWFEFKENWYEPVAIGEYISSLSNAAALEGREYGYLVWGVNNKTHEGLPTICNTESEYQELTFDKLFCIMQPKASC